MFNECTIKERVLSPIQREKPERLNWAILGKRRRGAGVVCIRKKMINPWNQQKAGFGEQAMLGP